MVSISSLLHSSRMNSLSRSATCPQRTFLRYFVLHATLVLDVIDRARSFPVSLHTLLLLKPSPKGAGFLPVGGTHHGELRGTATSMGL